jgi:hypothetical protein
MHFSLFNNFITYIFIDFHIDLFILINVVIIIVFLYPVFITDFFLLVFLLLLFIEVVNFPVILS